jgi:hypothetical protein
MSNRVELPTINELIDLGKRDPIALINLRDSLVNKIIERQTCDKQKEKLHKLQSHINMVESSSANKLHACMKISKMMHSKIEELSYVFIEGKRPLNLINDSKIILFKKPH